MKMKTTKGFTLTELLIVMAIIVVLAAVAIPTFGKQLETARETGDMEVIRNAYTEALSIASLDAADGKLNGLIGDGKTDGNDKYSTVADATSSAPAKVTKVNGDTTNKSIWGSVWWANTSTATINEVSTATGKYAVKLHSTASDDTDKTMNNAYFSQNAASKEWKYVSAQLMGVTVPQVDTTYDFVVFEFYIKDDGAVSLIPDSTAGTATAIVVATKP